MSILHVAVMVYREDMVRKIMTSVARNELLDSEDENFGMTPLQWCSTLGKRGRGMVTALQIASKPKITFSDDE